MIPTTGKKLQPKICQNFLKLQESVISNNNSEKFQLLSGKSLALLWGFKIKQTESPRTNDVYRKEELGNFN